MSSAIEVLKKQIKGFELMKNSKLYNANTKNLHIALQEALLALENSVECEEKENKARIEEVELFKKQFDEAKYLENSVVDYKHRLIWYLEKHLNKLRGVVNKKNKTYKQGIIDGYNQAQKDFFEALIKIKWL